MQHLCYGLFAHYVMFASRVKIHYIGRAEQRSKCACGGQLFPAEMSVKVVVSTRSESIIDNSMAIGCTTCSKSKRCLSSPSFTTNKYVYSLHSSIRWPHLQCDSSNISMFWTSYSYVYPDLSRSIHTTADPVSPARSVGFRIRDLRRQERVGEGSDDDQRTNGRS